MCSYSDENFFAAFRAFILYMLIAVNKNKTIEHDINKTG